MKSFLIAWGRGFGVLAFFIWLSLVIGVIGLIGDILPPPLAFLLFFLFGPPVLYWASKWLGLSLSFSPLMQRPKIEPKQSI